MASEKSPLLGNQGEATTPQYGESSDGNFLFYFHYNIYFWSCYSSFKFVCTVLFFYISPVVMQKLFFITISIDLFTILDPNLLPILMTVKGIVRVWNLWQRKVNNT